MITKQNERITYRAIYEDGDYLISANVITLTDGTLSLIESGVIATEGQNIADFSLSPDDFLMISCYDSSNATVVTEKINNFINQLREEIENEN